MLPVQRKNYRRTRLARKKFLLRLPVPPVADNLSGYVVREIRKSYDGDERNDFIFAHGDNFSRRA